MTTKKFFSSEHYKRMPVEPIKVIRGVLTPEQLEGFYWGNAIKYLLRAPYRGEYEKDMDKMVTFVHWLKDLRQKREKKEFGVTAILTPAKEKPCSE